MNTHSSLPLPVLPLILKGEIKFPKKLGEQIFKKSVWETKMGNVEEILTAMMVTNTVFRKSSLDLF